MKFLPLIFSSVILSISSFAQNFSPIVNGSSTLPSYVLTNASAFQPASGTLTNLSISNGGPLTNLNATTLVGSLPVASLPTGLSTNTVLWNQKVIPTYIATNRLYSGYGYILGDSLMVGYLSGVTALDGTTNAYSFFDYFKTNTTGMYFAMGAPFSTFYIIPNGNAGTTMDWLIHCSGMVDGTTNYANVGYVISYEAGVADIATGNATTNFTTPDAYLFNIVTNVVLANQTRQPSYFGGSPPVQNILFTLDNWETQAAWTAGKYNALYTNSNNMRYVLDPTHHYSYVTNLLNYVGTNATGLIITSNNMTFQQFQTYIYNYNVAIVNFVAARANGGTNIGIVRLDLNPSVMQSVAPDGWHTTYPQYIEIGKRWFDAFYNGKNDFSPVPVPQGFFLVSNGFGAGTLSTTMPVSALPTNVVPSIAFQLHDKTNGYTATTTYSALTNYTTLQNMRSDIFGGDLVSGYITNLVDGTYYISFNRSVRFGANNTEAIFTVLTNGVDAGIESWWSGSNPASATSGSAAGILYLPANCTISVGVKTLSGTLNITNVAGGLIITKQ